MKNIGGDAAALLGVYIPIPPGFAPMSSPQGTGGVEPLAFAPNHGATLSNKASLPVY